MCIESLSKTGEPGSPVSGEIPTDPLALFEAAYELNLAEQHLEEARELQQEIRDLITALEQQYPGI